MAEPGPKRLKTRLVTTIGEDPPFSYLPPDVIVSEILIHITVGLDILTREEDQVGPFAKEFACIGRFKRDCLRHRWAIFRSINVSPALQFLALTRGNKFSCNQYMILPLKYAVQFTVPLYSIRGLDTPEERVFQTSQFLQYHDEDLDFLKLERTPEKALLPSFKMPNLTTISSLLMGERNTRYPRATTIIIQAPMDEIPEWCEALRLMAAFWEDLLFVSSVARLLPLYFKKDSDLVTTIGTIGQQYRPRLVDIFCGLGYMEEEESSVVWNMANVWNLRRFIIRGKKWTPQLLFGGGPWYDFLRPLMNLEYLELEVTIPTRFDRHWFLPPVRKKLRVAGFSVPPGYVFPSEATFYDCRFDPTHTYLLPPEGVDILEIRQETKYDAPARIYEETRWNERLLDDLHGRTTMRGNVRKLIYDCLFELKVVDPGGPPIPLEHRQYVVERIGLPYEFVFNGNIEEAIIFSITSHAVGYPGPNLVRLIGQTEDLRLDICKFLNLIANQVTKLSMMDCHHSTVTIAEPVHGVVLERPEDVMLQIQSIGELVCRLLPLNFLTLGRGYGFTIHGSVDRAFVTGDVSFNFTCNFDRVINLTMENCKATVRINDLDAVQFITFVNIIARNITFIWPDDTPTVRIPRNKLIFMKMESREVSKLRRKLSQFTED